MKRLNTKQARLDSLNYQFNTLIERGFKREEYKDLNIFTGFEGGKYFLKIFSGTATNAICYYTARKMETLIESINQYKASADRREQYKADRKKTTGRLTGAAACADAIRKKLKEKFAGFKFSVKSETFSGGDSVRVHWTDGPTTAEVEAITGKYQQGRFDGMTDMYEYSNSREDIPQAKYISESRSMSEEISKKLYELCAPIYERNSFNCLDVNNMAYQLFAVSSFPKNAVIDGILQTEKECGWRLTDFYKINFEGQTQEPEKTKPESENEIIDWDTIFNEPAAEKQQENPCFAEITPEKTEYEQQDSACDVVKKEAWQITRDEYVKNVNAVGYWAETSAISDHNYAVRNALSEGKTIPVEVLSAYPELIPVIQENLITEPEQGNTVKNDRISEYRQRREERAARLLERAKNAKNAANSAYNNSKKIADCIPFGQPILVWHHSEARHRRDLNRINSGMQKSIDLDKKAEYYEEKAERLLNDKTISSDDPEAIDKLKNKIKGLESLQELMKSCNKVVRKKTTLPAAKKDKLIKLGLTEKQAEEILTPDFMGRLGFADFQLQNNNQNISSVKKRIEQLEKRATQETKEEEINGVRIVDNPEANRIQVFFDCIPDEKTRTQLKSNSFRWTPSQKCWQSYRSQWNKDRAKNIVQSMQLAEV